MRNIWTIAKREYDHYFISPIAYIVAFAILLAIGIVFGINFFYFSQNAFDNRRRARPFTSHRCVCLHIGTYNTRPYHASHLR